MGRLGRRGRLGGDGPAAIHLTPEALEDGPIALVRDGDPVRLDAEAGTLSLLVPEDELQQRRPARLESDRSEWGTGRELFSAHRRAVAGAEAGASIF